MYITSARGARIYILISASNSSVLPENELNRDTSLIAIGNTAVSKLQLVCNIARAVRAGKMKQIMCRPAHGQDGAILPACLIARCPRAINAENNQNKFSQDGGLLTLFSFNFVNILSS